LKGVDEYITHHKMRHMSSISDGRENRHAKLRLKWTFEQHRAGGLMSPVELSILIGLVMIVVFAAALWWVRTASRARVQALHERFPNATIAPANFYGQESAGAAQMRGNGTLVLTDTELYFERLWPRREYRISLAAIERVEIPSSYLGKTNFQPLLKVVFRNDAGQLDSMAWLVPDVESLKDRLEAAKR
jgi:hypothetical protein